MLYIAPAELPTNRCSPWSRVSHTIKEGQCYIGVYLFPARNSITTPAYTMQPQSYNNDRLQQSSTVSSLPIKALWLVHHNSSFAGL